MEIDNRTSLQYSVINARLCFCWLSIGVKKKIWGRQTSVPSTPTYLQGAKFLKAIKSELKPGERIEGQE